MSSPLSAPAAALLLALAACRSPPAPPLPPPPFQPELPSGGCGQPEHAWLDDTHMGEILSYEYLPQASMTADGLNLTLATLGYDQLGTLPYGTEVYRVRYLTQDRGLQIEATAVLTLPALDSFADVPTVLWVRPTVGFSDACALSGRLEGQLAQSLLAAFGYAVAAPDLLGMTGFGAPAEFIHPYIVPEPTAIAALDSVRALWRFADDEGPGDLPAAPTPRTIFWGASEGGFGALWADRYASGYAPEIDMVGVVASVPPTDIKALAVGAMDGWHDATVGLAPVLATSAQWYGGAPPFKQVFTNDAPNNIASSLLDALASSCEDGPDPFDGLSSPEQIYTPDFIDAVRSENWSQIEPWSCYLDKAVLRNSEIERGHNVPVLYQVSAYDDLVLADIGRADGPALCDAGYEIEYLECAGASHESGAADSLPYQINWVARRFAGAEYRYCAFPPAIACNTLP